MILSDFTYAVLITLAGLGGYLWGYREGVRYCVKQLGPFEELLKQLDAARRK